MIEIPLGGVPVKYEIDKESGALFVDRFLHTAMFYPGNYGFIPHTLVRRRRPMRHLVVGQVPVVPGAVIRCRPVGALMMEDEAGGDEKILAVPVDALHPFYRGVRSYRDLPAIMCEQIAHFFQHYKDLEKGKWVTITRWLDAREAEQLIIDGMKRFQGLEPKNRRKTDKAVEAPAAKSGKKAKVKAATVKTPVKKSKTKKAVKKVTKKKTKR